MIKIITVLSLFTYAFCNIAYSAVNKDTANYYKAQANLYIGKEISLDVSHVKALKPLSNLEGVSFFTALTVEDGEMENGNGGNMLIVLPESETTSFIKKFGLSMERDARRKVETRTLRGDLQNIELKSWELLYVDYDGTMKEVIEANKEEVIKAFSGEGAGPGNSGPGKGRPEFKGKPKRPMQ
jgi:hypothetical protein